jgi:hypothetical protein
MEVFAMTIAPPPGTALPPPAVTRPGPSTRGYWIGGLLTAAAVISAISWVVVAFFAYQQQIDGYLRMTVPGVAAVQVTDASTRVLYFEDVRGAITPTTSELGLTVTDPAGAPVAVSPYGGDLRYDLPGDSSRVGRAVAQFHPDQVETYQVGSTPPARVVGTLAVGADAVRDIGLHLLGAGALLLLVGGAGVAVLIVTAVRRSSNARR